MTNFGNDRITEHEDWVDAVNKHRSWATDRLTDIEQRIQILEHLVRTKHEVS